MDHQLETTFRALEAARGRMLDRIGSCSAVRQHQQPSPQEWSMVQVAILLMIVEERILASLQQQLRQPETPPAAGLGAWIRFTAVKLVLRYQKKLTTPSQVAPPGNELSYLLVKQRWNETRRQWWAFLMELPGEAAGKEAFRHPVAGMMSTYQALGFMHEILSSTRIVAPKKVIRLTTSLLVFFSFDKHR